MTVPLRNDELTTTIAEMVATATDGTIGDAADATGTFADAGMTSLSFLRLVDAIEIAYGVEIDLENDLERMRTVVSIVDFLTEHGIR